MQRTKERKSSRSKLAAACGAAGFALWMSSVAPAALVYRTVALTGTDGTYGPGDVAGVTFTSLSSGQPSINSSGQVLLRGISSAEGTPGGLWLNNGVANTVQALNGAAQ